VHRVPALPGKIDKKAVRIAAPTLISNATGSRLRPIDWQQRVSQSQFVIIEGDAWHTSGTHPDYFAVVALQFIVAQRYHESLNSH